jgi:hypothetical protein
LRVVSIEDAISTYILAKDGNRPFLMPRAFAPDAELAMQVKTDAISFPGSAKGRASITDILVSRFASDYEDIFTFCLSRPAPEQREHFACDWLVGMSTKQDGAVRVGCGRYDWRFNEGGLISKLAIAIEAMEVLPVSAAPPVFAWLGGLPYPWCTNDQALAAMPALAELATIRSFLGVQNP